MGKSAKRHDLLKLVFQLHHQSQKGSIFVHGNIATSNEAFDQVDALVDVVDHLHNFRLQETSRSFSVNFCVCAV